MGPRAPTPRRERIAIAVVAIAFFALGGIQIGALGIPSEEILPHLFAHPRVAADATLDSARLTLESPYDLPHGDERTGLVVAKVWPVLSVVTPRHSYPILVEIWQSAHFSYLAAVAAPILGGGIEGLRRSALLVGALVLVLVALLAPRLSRAPAQERWLGTIAAGWLATSTGFLFVHRTAYLIESAPPLLATLVLYLALDGRRSRFVLGGFVAGLALATKATTGWLFVGLVAYLVLGKRFPRQRAHVWGLAAAAGLFALLPILVFFWHEHAPEVVGRTGSLMAEPLRALVRLPHIAWITAAYLGDPNVILEPLLAGELRLVPQLWAAVLPLGMSLFAAYRVVRTPGDRQPELLWLCVAPAVTGFAALLYGAENPFQIALFLEPFYAIVVARALYAIYRRLIVYGRPIIVATVLLVAAATLQSYELAGFAGAHRSVGNPMLAMQAQRQIVAALIARGEEAPLTATYNSMGFYEFLSHGRIRPIHLHRVLQPYPDMDAREYEESSTRAWMIALLEHPGPVILPLGYNVFEGGGQDRDLVRRAFFGACQQLGVSAHESARFPADGPPAFGLYELVGSPRLSAPIPVRQRHPRQDVRNLPTPASAQTRALLGGLDRGARLDVLVVEDITDPFGGAIFVRTRSPSGGRATFEVRLMSAAPPPPAQSRGYAIFYRHPDGEVSSTTLTAGAAALARIMDGAPAGLRPPPGLSRHPGAGAR